MELLPLLLYTFFPILVFVFYKFFSPTSTGDVNKIPGPKPIFFFGNILEMMKDPLHYSNNFGGIFKYFYFTQAVIVVTEPEIVKHVLSGSKSFAKDQDPIILDVIGKGLLLSNGELWKKQRKLMIPAFGYAYMKHMVPCFIEAVSVLIQKWEKLSDLEPVNVHTEMTRLTLDVIGEAGFGYKFNSLTNEKGQLPQAVTAILHETEQRIFRVLPTWKIPFLPSTVQFQKAKKILDSEIEKMIRERREKGVSESDQDLLGRLLAAKDPETGETISDSQLRDELITFLIAGHETTAAMLAFVFYVLSQYPSVEAKLQQEIDQVLKGKVPEFDDLNNMPYLDLVIKETMRLYPSVSMQTTRVLIEDERLGEFNIPKGTNVEVWPWLIHRNPKYWENPLEFIPERHQEKRENTFIYLPFGAGSRECIGKRLALTESKIVLSMVLQKFSLKMAKGHKVVPKLFITLRPDDLVMNILPRS